MGLLQPAKMETAYAKVGIHGFQGDGKTFTAMELAESLAEYLVKLGIVKEGKIAFFDTEKGSDWFVDPKRPGYTKRGNRMDAMKSRSFQDLVTFVKECEAGGYIGVMDSMTHVWKDLTQSYKVKLGRKKLMLYDWDPLKTEWGQFTTNYVNSRCHLFMLGRSGYEYDDMEIEGPDDTTEIKSVKTGTKMKTEGETGFEPDLLIEMSKVHNPKATGSFNAGSDVKEFINRCLVTKDRSDKLNGKVFDFPKFTDFMPFFETLALGGEHRGPDLSRNSEGLFEREDTSWIARKRNVEITLEKIKGDFQLAGKDGSSEAAKKERAELLLKFFGTTSWTEISNMRLENLVVSYDALHLHLNPAPVVNTTPASAAMEVAGESEAAARLAAAVEAAPAEVKKTRKPRTPKTAEAVAS